MMIDIRAIKVSSFYSIDEKLNNNLVSDAGSFY
jgi:hypothetical protein